MTPKRQRRSRSRRGRKNGFSIELRYMPISRAYYPASKRKWLEFASLN